jgi:hypothetical protein
MLRTLGDLALCLICALPFLVAYWFWPDWLWLGVTVSIIGAYYLGSVFGPRDPIRGRDDGPRVGQLLTVDNTDRETLETYHQVRASMSALRAAMDIQVTEAGCLR